MKLAEAGVCDTKQKCIRQQMPTWLNHHLISLNVVPNYTAKGCEPHEHKQNTGSTDMSENTNAGRVSIPLQRELEPSAEELLRLVMDNFFVNHKGGIEWGIKEGYPLAEVVGATMERNLAKYLPEKSVIKYNEKNGLKTDGDDNSKRKNR